jgi:acyl carrier protein
MDREQGISNVDIKNKFNSFIRNKFLLGDDSKALDDNDSFLDKGIIDSTGVLELVNFIEETFDVNVEDEELVPDNLDSINKLVSYIKRKT